jgi:hypothetical protein
VRDTFLRKRESVGPVEVALLDPHAVAEHADARGAAIGVEARHHAQPLRLDLRAVLELGERHVATELVAAHEHFHARPSTAIAQVHALREVAEERVEEPQPEAELLLHVDARAGLHPRLELLLDRIGHVRPAHQRDRGLGPVRPFGAAARDPHELRSECHRAVDRERELLPRRRCIGPAEQRRVELVDVAAQQRHARELGDRIVRVELDEIDLLRPQHRGELHEREHVHPRIRQLELPHLEPRLLAVEREAALRGERSLGLQRADQLVDLRHRSS